MHPNSLWQCDLKLVDSRWLIGILDEHSRFVPGSEIFAEGTAENVMWLLDKAIHEYSKPKEILTDHASSGAYEEENPASTRTANMGSNIFLATSRSLRRRGRLSDGSERQLHQ
jgi:hypothetical protein